MNHFRSFAILLLLTCGSLVSQAQEFRLGGGYSGSNVSKTSSDDWVGRAGYQFGADILLGGVWFVKPGVHLLVRNLDYTVVGVGPDGTPTGTDVDYRYTSRSLRVPLLVGRRLLDPSNEPAFNIYVVGGPTALFNLSADLDNDAFTVETQAAQWYIGFGGGLEISFIFVEAGYDVAMSNVFKGDDFTTNPKVNNLYVSAGARLRLAK